MMKRKNISIALLALLVSGLASAEAGEFRHRFHHYGQGWQEGAAGVNGLPVHIRGIGTFAGGITATRIHGNGVYIAIAPGLTGEPAAPAQRVKIINVSENPEKDNCSMEHGVCVIRAR
ncbi:hypothetical protein [Rhizobium sp. C4]|uniref:hypothetical protein n=1 Tax=Rhizobium sp. C4 TaxID=1349800 RepID=UPI001E2CE609|nr:hypothetical protein [Rhizobium sp. C4]MCD2175477.1 hypothetical protein [Rhizobium sp. C4]